MFDVIVAGLGGVGSAAAYQLAARGKRVLGLERHAPAHALGSSHGGSRIIRQAYFEDPAYVPLLFRAYELWRRLEQESGEEHMTLTGELMCGLQDSELVSGSVKSAEEHGLLYELLDALRRIGRVSVFVVLLVRFELLDLVGAEFGQPTGHLFDSQLVIVPYRRFRL